MNSGQTSATEFVDFTVDDIKNAIGLLRLLVRYYV